MANQIILVTGANGFLGSEVVRCLKAEPVSIRTTGLEDTFSKKDVEYYQADILQTDQIAPVIAGASMIIHTAGLAHVFKSDRKSSDKFQQVNENGTAIVASIAARENVKHFVLISSVSVYGPCDPGYCDEGTPCNPISPYALSKHRAELRALEIARESGMALTILRLTTLYGEEDRGNVYRLMRIIDSGRFFWIGDGRNRKSLLHKEDAARACARVAVRPVTGIRTYNVSAYPATMLDIVQELSKGLGKTPLPVQIPSRLALIVASAIERLSGAFGQPIRLRYLVEKWLEENTYDSSLFESTYGFHPSVPLQDGLRREIEWYRNAH